MYIKIQTLQYASLIINHKHMVEGKMTVAMSIVKYVFAWKPLLGYLGVAIAIAIYNWVPETQVWAIIKLIAVVSVFGISYAMIPKRVIYGAVAVAAFTIAVMVWTVSMC